MQKILRDTTFFSPMIDLSDEIEKDFLARLRRASGRRRKTARNQRSFQNLFVPVLLGENPAPNNWSPAATPCSRILQGFFPATEKEDLEGG